MHCRLPLVSALAIAAIAGRAHAALYVYEGFDYPIAADGLAAQNGGIGFSGAWDDVTNDGEIVAPSLSYTDGGGRILTTTGNMARMDGSAAGTAVNFRSVDSAQYASATTLYLSFLGQKELTGTGTPLDARAVNFAFFSNTSERVSVGHGTNTPAGGFGGEYRWGFFTNGNGGNGQVGDLTNGHYSSTGIQNAVFAVLRIDLNANGANETLRLYINPSLDAEPAVPSAIVIDTRDIATVMSDLNRFRPFGGNTTASGSGILNLDEIRLGSTWADVTPFTVIPEPAAAALLPLAGLAFLRRRRA